MAAIPPGLVLAAEQPPSGAVAGNRFRIRQIVEPGVTRFDDLERLFVDGGHGVVGDVDGHVAPQIGRDWRHGGDRAGRRTAQLRFSAESTELDPKVRSILEDHLLKAEDSCVLDAVLVPHLLHKCDSIMNVFGLLVAGLAIGTPEYDHV